MKNLFYEYYPLSDDKIKEIWDEGIIIFDTNALLNLYRYSEKLKNDFLEVLNHYKDRLWIPYQVGLEYHSNRIKVITNSNNAYIQLSNELHSEVERFVKSLSTYKRHPYIKIDDISERIKTCINEIVENLDKKEKEAPNYLKNDDVLDKLTTLFDGKVGEDFKESDLKDLYKKGQGRYEKKIPPGYCDEKEKKNKGERHQYGDFILWKQIIQKASETKKNVIFVSDDLKEDWLEKVNGRNIGPRKELLNEFRKATQKDILKYNAERFLKYAQENMSVAIEKETIIEIENFRKEDESIQQIISSAQDNSSEELIKAHATYPWSSAQLIADINKVLGKDCLCSPNELITRTGTIPRVSDIVGKMNLGGTESIIPAVPRVSDIVGKMNLGGTESIIPAVPKVSDIVGKMNLGGTKSITTDV